MANTPEIYFKVRIEEPGKHDRFEFLTRTQLSTRGLLRQLFAQANPAKYVKIGNANFQLLSDWERAERAKRGKR